MASINATSEMSASSACGPAAGSCKIRGGLYDNDGLMRPMPGLSMARSVDTRSVRLRADRSAWSQRVAGRTRALLAGAVAAFPLRKAIKARVTSPARSC